MSRIKQKTFQKDGWKRLPCRNCGRIIGTTNIKDKEPQIKRCKECKNKQIIIPPRKGIMDGKTGYFWCEPSDSCFTAINIE